MWLKQGSNLPTDAKKSWTTSLGLRLKANIVGMDDCDGYVRGWGTYQIWTHQKGATGMCEGGTYHGWVPLALMSVSLSKSPTQAYKGNENVLLIRISADQEMDAS
jgi:hypothetical protein